MSSKQSSSANNAGVLKRNDLGYLGTDFQEKLVKVFFEDKTFFENLQHIVDQNMFTNEHLRRIVGLMKNRYSTSATPPSYDEVKLLIRMQVRDMVTVELLEATVEKLKNMHMESVDIIEDQCEKFFKQQNLVKAINKASDIIRQGDFNKYPEIEGYIQEALMVNSRQDNGFRLFENVERALSPDYRQTIPTGCLELDKALFGGLGRRELGVIVAPMGVGKAQPLNSLVLTPLGYKKMGEVEVGDTVIGGDGKPHKVIGTFPQEGLRPVYKVYFSNGEVVECDIDHLWNVNTYYQRTRKTYVRGSGRKQCVRKFNPDYTFKTWSLRDMIERGITKEFLNGKKTSVFKVPCVSPIHFESQHTDVDPYLAGYYIGDGCYSRYEITVGCQDFDETYNRLKDIVGEEHITFSYDKKRNVYAVRLIGDLRKKLNAVFGNTKKSGEKRVPKCFVQNSINTRLAVLQGLLDSDGTVGCHNGTVLFSTKSEGLAQDVKYIVKSLGGYASIKIKPCKYKYKGEVVDCGISYNVSISMTETVGFPLFRLSRKQERVRYRTKYLEEIYIDRVEYDRDDYTKCILVDSEEHTYVTDGFIVTHNTSATTGFAASAATYKCEANNNRGFRVLHFFFEDEEVNIERKYYGYVLNIDACELSLPNVRPTAIARLNEDTEIKRMLKENIVCQRLSTGEVTASSLKQKIKHQISLGFIPDLVIVDYFECLAREKGSQSKANESEWTGEAITMRKLEATCKELNIAMWVPVQGTKGSIGADYVGLMHAGGSVTKTQIGHVVMQFAQTKEQKSQGLMNIYIGKLRAVRIDRDEFLNIKFNNGTCKFDMTSTNSEIDRIMDEGPSRNAQVTAARIATTNH